MEQHEDDQDLDDALGVALGELFGDDEFLDDPDVPPAANPPRLVTRTGLGDETTLFMTAKPLFIGSGQGMDITVEHPEVARRHAAVVPRGGGYILKELSATPGHTHVNGKVVSSWRLRDGDLLRVGNVDVHFHWPDQPASDRDAAGGVAPTFEPLEEEAPAGGRRRGLLLGVGALVVLAVGVLLFSPGLQDTLLGYPPREMPEPPLPPEVQAGLDTAYAAGEALLAAGRHQAAERVVQEALIRADVQQPRGEALLAATAELAVAEAAYWDLWSTLAEDGSREGRYALLMAEGRSHLAEAQRAHLSGAPTQVVERLAGRAEAAFSTASKLRRDDGDAKKGVDESLSLVGRAGVGEDNLAARLQRDALEVLTHNAMEAEAQGRFREALMILAVAQERAAEEAPELAPQLKVQRERAERRMNETRLPLVEAGDVAREGGRPVEARTLYQAALVLGPEDDALRARLTNLEPTLLAKAKEVFARAQELERSGQGQDAWLLYRQVLEYVPDRTTDVYGDARARLEALARAE